MLCGKYNRVMGSGGRESGLRVLRWGGQGSFLEEMALELRSHDGKKPAG